MKYSNGWAEITTEVSCRTNPKKTIRNTVKFVLYIHEGKIIQINWKVFGDPVAIATCSWIYEQTYNKYISDLVHTITPERAALDLDINDDLQIRGGCGAAIQAFINAIDYHSLVPPK